MPLSALVERSSNPSQTSTIKPLFCPGCGENFITMDSTTKNISKLAGAIDAISKQDGFELQLIVVESDTK